MKSMRYLFPQLLLLVLLTALPHHVDSSTNQVVHIPLKRYAYICLAARPNLCLGVSPGPGPNMPYPGIPLQVKPQLNNALSQMDWKKMRWNFDSNPTSLRLTNISNLCVDASTFQSPLLLFNCSENDRQVWTFDATVGVLRYSNSPWCATVHQCQPHNDATQSCNLNALNVQTNGANLVPGSSIHLNGCFDTVPGNAAYAVAQVFIRDFDCAPGCAPYMLNNHVCDVSCNVSL